MAIYYLAIGIDPTSGNNPVSDGKHYDGEYGFAVDAQDGKGINPIGPGSGSSGRQFEAVLINPPGGANGSPLNILLFDNCDNGLTPGSSFMRVAFRPGHDTGPAPNVDTSPLAPNDTQNLLNGVSLPAATNSVTASSAPRYGLPTGTYKNVTLLPACTLSGRASTPPPSFEVTVEVKAVWNGTSYYFKVDPEMMIDF